jgi:hypothetical protein
MIMQDKLFIDKDKFTWVIMQDPIRDLSTTVDNSTHEDVGQSAPKVGEVLRVFMITLDTTPTIYYVHITLWS